MSRPSTKETTIAERVTLESIILAQLDFCIRMKMQAELTGDPSVYYAGIKALVKLFMGIADEEFLEEIAKINQELKSARDKASKMWFDSPYRKYTVNLTKFADKQLDSCLRLMQKREMGLTTIEREKWQ